MSNLIDIDTPIAFGCEDCKHHKGGLKCAAFDVIPLDIYSNAEAHTSVVSGQNGSFVFTPAKDREVYRAYQVED